MFRPGDPLDTDYALAYAGLADCYSILRVPGGEPAGAGRARALDAARSATGGPAIPSPLSNASIRSTSSDIDGAQWSLHRCLAPGPRNAMFEAYFGPFPC